MSQLVRQVLGLSHVSDVPRPAGRRAAAKYLRELLTQQGPYRRRWERHVVRSRSSEITQLAVAEVLAQHHSAAIPAARSAQPLPYQTLPTSSALPSTASAHPHRRPQAEPPWLRMNKLTRS